MIHASIPEVDTSLNIQVISKIAIPINFNLMCKYVGRGASIPIFLFILQKKWLVDFLLTLLLWILSASMPNIVYCIDKTWMNYWTR